jgi:hypothetical protein
MSVAALIVENGGGGVVVDSVSPKDVVTRASGAARGPARTMMGGGNYYNVGTFSDSSGCHLLGLSSH